MRRLDAHEKSYGNGWNPSLNCRQRTACIAGSHHSHRTRPISRTCTLIFHQLVILRLVNIVSSKLCCTDCYNDLIVNCTQLAICWLEYQEKPILHQLYTRRARLVRHRFVNITPSRAIWTIQGPYPSNSGASNARLAEWMPTQNRMETDRILR